VASYTHSEKARRRSALATHLSRDTLVVLGALTVAVVLAWAWLFFLPMGGSMANPLSVGYLLPAFVMWAIMMIAMMVPSATPMILLHARIDRAQSPTLRTAHTLLFAVAYVLVWAGFSAAAALTQALLVQTGVVSAMGLTVGNRTIAAGLLFLAATYEITAAKRLCLDKCNSPLMFMLKNFRPGAAGAFRLGLVHGLFCLGCCWALMLLLFIGGVMNLAWVAILGVVVLGEKFAPPHWHAERYLAAALLLGSAVVLAG
jgi:predicted metal-binding membrane protein